MMQIALCAGEPSGDALGADLIKALKKRWPEASFTGIAGPKMQAQGCVSLFPMETLSVMGVAEVLPKLPAILKVRSQLIKHLLDNPPDVFIGIDSPDFTLGVEKALKKAGIKTVHYVSPTVWAWREKRVLGIKKSTDLMLCVFPFETTVYEKYGAKAEFIGHPAVERLGSDESPRSKQGVCALMPGSRRMEIEHHAPLFLEVANQLSLKHPEFEFKIPAVNEKLKERITELYNQSGFNLKLTISVGNSEQVMRESDLVLCASGTTTLEAMILNKPMVVAYRMTAFNWFLARLLVHVKFIAIPNLLADKKLVPEFVQDEANLYNLTQAVETWLNQPDLAHYCKELYRPYREPLAQNASEKAADAISALLEGSSHGKGKQTPTHHRSG